MKIEIYIKQNEIKSLRQIQPKSHVGCDFGENIMFNCIYSAFDVLASNAAPPTSASYITNTLWKINYMHTFENFYTKSFCKYAHYYPILKIYSSLNEAGHRLLNVEFHWAGIWA